MDTIEHMDEDSISAYEASTDGDQSSSHDKEGQTQHTSFRTVSRGRSSAIKPATSVIEESSRADKARPRASSETSEETQTYRQDARLWASNFDEPKSAQDIKSPTRKPFGARVKRKIEKRKTQESASRSRAKRVKGYHSNSYRELLNVEIRDASTRTIPEDHASLDQGQIGLSVWTSKEKEDFFSALSRLGRDNFREITLRVQTKSEIEIQECIHALHQATKKRNLEDSRSHPETGYHRYQPLLTFTDHPAAVEISEECCNILERAGDAISSRLASYESQKEEAKWGEIWLLTNSVSRFLEDKAKSEGGPEEVGDILPAANLLNLKNWLELSHRAFMNPAAPREEDNWQMVAEPGESPAIFATAFEDFFSLALSITKRLVSTTLFQTMARLRVTNSNNIKHKQISPQDVEAAVKMLGLQSNSNNFWRGCPRRCTLDIYDDSRNNSDATRLTYNEVEDALNVGNLDQSRSRSRSKSAIQSKNPNRRSSSTESRDSEEVSDFLSELQDSESDIASTHSEHFPSDLAGYESLEITDDEFPGSNKRRREARKKRIEEAKANNRALEEYTRAFDEEASRMEEQRLWTLLRLDPPFEIKPEPIELPDRPKNFRGGVVEPDWRDNLEYWSQWETLPTPIPAENFMKNRRRKAASTERTGRQVYKTRLASRLTRRTIPSDIEMTEDESNLESPDESAEEEVSDAVDDIAEQSAGASDEEGPFDNEEAELSDGDNDISKQPLEASADEGAVDHEEWLRTIRSPSFGADDFSKTEAGFQGEGKD